MKLVTDHLAGAALLMPKYLWLCVLYLSRLLIVTIFSCLDFLVHLVSFKIWKANILNPEYELLGLMNHVTGGVVQVSDSNTCPSARLGYF